MSFGSVARTAPAEGSGRAPRTLRDLVLGYERVLIIEALARCRGSRTQAARALGVRRQYLYARIKATGVDLAQVTEAARRAAGAARG